MPRIKLTKSIIDSLRTPNSDVVYWDAGVPGFGVEVTPKGRKVCIVLCRTGGAGSKLRKYTSIVVKASRLREQQHSCPPGATDRVDRRRRKLDRRQQRKPGMDRSSATDVEPQDR